MRRPPGPGGSEKWGSPNRDPPGSGPGQGKWGSPNRDQQRGTGSLLRPGHIWRLRCAILVLCALVVASGLIYSPALRPGVPRIHPRGEVGESLGAGWGNATLSVLSRLRGTRRRDDLSEFRDILSERDAFLHRPRVLPSPPPPSPPPSPPPPVVRPPRILAITPTYARAFQEVYITRLASMLRSVADPILWIVIESPHKTEETASLLERTAGLCLPFGRPTCRKLDYVHIETGEVERAKMNKAVVHRNAGLDYIERQRLEGIIYFMDDDNSYAPQLFEELRKIKWIGALPVGFLYTQEYSRRNPHLHNTPIVERPLVRERGGGEGEGGGAQQGGVTGEVYGWETFEWFVPKPGVRARMINIDMAGFGFSSAALWAEPNEKGFPKKPVRFKATHMGFLEDNFLLTLIHDKSELEPLGESCTDVWVWHIHMEQDKNHRYPKGWYCQQPKKLVKVEDDDHSVWPFVIRKSKYGVEGRGNRGGMFIYE